MLKVRAVEFSQQLLRTRFPFRYGIASMTEVPHLFVRAEVQLHGKTGYGISADLLPPKWFTKDPLTDYTSHDLPEMRQVIERAAEIACEIPATHDFFCWWKELYTEQMKWCAQKKIAPLLAAFGVSLIERSVIDAWCRIRQITFHQLLKSKDLGIDLGELRSELKQVGLLDCIAQSLPTSLQLRHTIGLGDPLTDAEISPDDQVQDGLPQSLEACIRRYGMRYFKIKISGNLLQDTERLQGIARLLTLAVKGEFQFSMDGNENYTTIEHFRNDFEDLRAQPALRKFFDQGLLFVEQPLHRNHALSESVRSEILSWSTAPPLIIDESDADLNSVPLALNLGYSGTSHKNCKGIMKGLANAASIHQAGTARKPAILSSEDLANVAPVALMQDLAVAASLGITHSERNGHHYFAGLSQFSTTVQKSVLEQHADLFQASEQGFPVLKAQDGQISLASVLQIGFGQSFDPEHLEVAWRPEIPKFEWPR